jgi:hypothetical protein
MWLTPFGLSFFQPDAAKKQAKMTAIGPQTSK